MTEKDLLFQLPRTFLSSTPFFQIDTKYGVVLRISNIELVTFQYRNNDQISFALGDNLYVCISKTKLNQIPLLNKEEEEAFLQLMIEPLF